MTRNAIVWRACATSTYSVTRLGPQPQGGREERAGRQVAQAAATWAAARLRAAVRNPSLQSEPSSLASGSRRHSHGICRPSHVEYTQYRCARECGRMGNAACGRPASDARLAPPPTALPGLPRPKSTRSHQEEDGVRGRAPKCRAGPAGRHPCSAQGPAAAGSRSDAGPAPAGAVAANPPSSRPCLRHGPSIALGPQQTEQVLAQHGSKTLALRRPGPALRAATPPSSPSQAPSSSSLLLSSHRHSYPFVVRTACFKPSSCARCALCTERDVHPRLVSQGDEPASGCAAHTRPRGFRGIEEARRPHRVVPYERSAAAETRAVAS